MIEICLVCKKNETCNLPWKTYKPTVQNPSIRGNRPPEAEDFASFDPDIRNRASRAVDKLRWTECSCGDPKCLLDRAIKAYLRYKQSQPQPSDATRNNRPPENFASFDPGRQRPSNSM